MISYLSGKIAHKETGSLIIDVGGVGFRVFMPTIDLALVPEEGREAKIYTYFHVREDAMELYGFSDKKGIEYFNKLLSVNGVGCKAALAILSALPPSELAAAIVSGDAKAISRAQGVGGKIAQRIILELREKVGIPDAEAFGAAKTPAAAAASEDVKAINALIALGCSPSEAQKTVVGISSEGKTLATEEIIKEALRRMSNGI